MATTRGGFGQLLAPGLNDLLFEWLEEHPEEFSQFLNVGTDDGAYLEDQIIAGLGLARTKLEGEEISYDDPIQGATQRYLHVTYALGWQITMEMMQDDRYSLMKRMPGELMKSHRQVWEQAGTNILQSGMPGGTVNTADGVTLFNSAHPLLGGSTYSNVLSPLADLSVTSLQDGIILQENMVNERGLRMMIKPSKLWMPPELQFVAQEILQSQYKPYTANNEVNPMQGRLDPAILHFLTDNTFWAISSGDDPNNVKFIWRSKPVADTIDDFETKGAKHSVVCRFSTGATDWRGWVGGNS
jgi:hypothetical protein